MACAPWRVRVPPWQESAPPWQVPAPAWPYGRWCGRCFAANAMANASGLARWQVRFVVVAGAQAFAQASAGVKAASTLAEETVAEEKIAEETAAAAIGV